MRRRPFAAVLLGPSGLLREGLTRILSEADFRIIASAPCIDDLVATVLPQRQSILLVIDAGDDLNAAVGQVGLVKQRHPTARVAVLADHAQPNDIVSVFRAGANAFFIRVAPCDTFIKSLELVMLGETILPPAVLSAISDYTNDDEDTHELAASDDGVTAGKLLEPQSHDTPQLSTREKFVLKCLTEGNSNKTIARRINIADATVKVHVKAILRKIRVHNRTQAAIWAMNNDLSVATASDGPSAPAKPADHLPVNARARIGSSRNGGPAFLPVKVDHLK
jgi:two-component system, NarL family, nitrate/nitrite response regulator NarL